MYFFNNEVINHSYTDNDDKRLHPENIDTWTFIDCDIWKYVFSCPSADLKPHSLYRYFRYRKNLADRKSSLWFLHCLLPKTVTSAIRIWHCRKPDLAVHFMKNFSCDSDSARTGKYGCTFFSKYFFSIGSYTE